MDRNVLVLFAHPLLEKSRIHRALLDAVLRRQERDEVSFCDLYHEYPDFNINIRNEQERLNEADFIIFQHPVYWYSTPPLIKQYFDLVLEYGWAYGPGGHHLEGKSALSVISSGGTSETYSREGRHEHTIQEFFLPVKRTVELCNMHYLPPYVIHGSHRITDDELQDMVDGYGRLLDGLRNGAINLENAGSHNYINEMTL